MKKSILIIALSFIVTCSVFSQIKYEDLTWPREIFAEGYTITLYQPQLESFEGNKLDSRMAVSISNKKDLIFGAVWLDATVSTDMDERVVALEEINIPKINFPDINNEDKAAQLSALLIKEIESWNIVLSYDQLIASLSELENTEGSSNKINNDPPAIYFRTTPSTLISIDGDPFYKTDEAFKLDYLVNTPSFIVKSDNKFYIKEGKFWYSSNEALKGYSNIDKAPKNVSEFADKYGKDIVLDSFELAMKTAPELIVVTKPSELISTNGEPDYQSIKGTSLLYAKNTEDDIIMDINSQEHYILLAGRWYRSKNLKDGTWVFVDPEDLPADFALIPAESDMGNVLASVPNTEEAQDALLAQSIPQTAKVDRKTATVEVNYDGEPKFEKIEGSSVSYAVNTDKTVLLINKQYYCVDDAIWFVSDKATGPWLVSTERPDEVDEIPADSPVYNVKYVYVYESTPEVVYVGYYPGYTYSYVYHGVIVYGTGYTYPYWYGAYYYPRPVTYGYGVHYNPYTGWGFTVGISVGWGYHPYGCWGPAGYHYGYRSAYYHGYNHGYHNGYHNGYNQGYKQGARAGYNAANRNNNVYADRKNGIQQTGTARNTAANRKTYENKSKPSSKQNNLYADSKGDVYQQKKNGTWENKTNASNKLNNANNAVDKSFSKDAKDRYPSDKNATNPSKANNASKPATTKPTTNNVTKPTTTKPTINNTRPSSTTQPSYSRPNNNSMQQQLNRDAQARSRGTQNLNRSNTGAARTGGTVRRR
jgi:hypothetical protein